MKKYYFMALFLICVLSCSTGQKNPKQDEPKQDEPKQVKNDVVTVETVETGWLDNDTYTVHVSAENLDAAKDKAQYQILKDIVRVRTLNRSRYTDITKIQVEFEKPLKNGMVIKKNDISSGVEIWFRITDKGLKEKFQRQ